MNTQLNLSRIFRLGWILVAAVTFVAANVSAEPTLKALLITGQSNHAWQVAHPILETILKDTGLFAVEVAKTPESGQDMSGFAPIFSDFQVVVLNYTGDDWPEPVRAAFLDYVRNGGGVVVVHEANNAFPEWPEYNEIIGLGGWGNRNERHGPYVRWRNGEILYDMTPGPGGAHGRRHEFVIEHRVTDHPITAGLPATWRHAQDELYHQLRGPAKNMILLATAWSDPETGGTGEHEPILFTVQYGKGRMFQTVLGHPGENAESTPSMQCAGFIVTLQRGAEWAATGNVTQAVPEDFPAEDATRLRPRFIRETVEGLMKDLAAYKFNDSLEPLVLLEEWTRKRLSMDDAVDDLEEGYLAVLQCPDISREARMFAAKQLSIVGGRKSIGTLAQLLYDEQAGGMARFALERIPESAALTALREALPKVGPEQRAGIISSLAARKDARAVTVISAAIHDEDARVVANALHALAALGTPEAAASLRIAMDLKTGDARALAQDAWVHCGFSMLHARRTRDARALFEEAPALLADNPPARAAAVRGRIAVAGRRGGDVIAEILQSDDVDMHPIAAAAVRDMADRRALRKAAELLPGLAPYAQTVLLTALSETQAEDITALLVEAARAEAEEVRRAALEAIGRVGCADAAVFLAERAAVAPGREQECARFALSRLRGADPVILDALKSGDAALRPEWLRAVAARRISGAAPMLLDLLKTAAVEDRVALLDVLTQVAEPEHLDMIMPLLLAPDAQADGGKLVDMVASVSEKAETGEARIAAVKKSLETETDASARGTLYATLGKIADDSALPLLNAGLEESDAAVRLAAVEALSAWTTDAPLEILRGAAERFRGTAEGAAALQGFLRLTALNKERSGDEALALFQSVLSLADRPEDKQACMAAIGKTGEAAALPLLYDALGQADETLAMEAVRALGNWPDATPMIRLELLAKDGPEALRPEALRGYFRLIGLNREIPEEEAVQRYQDALALAATPADQKRILSGLANAQNPGALKAALEYLGNPELKNEAEAAAIKIAAQIMGAWPDAVAEALLQIGRTTESEYVRSEIEKLSAGLARFENHITAWEVSGPYTLEDGDGKKLFETAFPPELPDQTETVKWSAIPVGTHASMPFLVELDKAMDGQNRVAYLRTFLWVETEQNALLELGSDDGNRVWLNNELVAENNAVRPAAPAQDTAAITLRAGWNPLLMKVTQSGGEWSACARVRTPDGAPVPGLRASVRPQ